VETIASLRTQPALRPIPPTAENTGAQPRKPPHGYRSAVAWDEKDQAWITVGSNGSDISYDDGKTWQWLDSGNWNALSLPWAVGPNGQIGKLGTLPAPPAAGMPVSR
jgi:hypothetical protein